MYLRGGILTLRVREMGRFFAYIALLLLTLSCQKGGEDGVVPYGTLNLEVEQPDVLLSADSSLAQAYMSSSYSVTIKKLLDGEVAYSGTVGAMPPDMALRSGIYTITVESSRLDRASYVSPYCFGEQKITISDSGSETIRVPLDIESTAVIVEYSEAFLSHYDSYQVVVCSDGDSLVFDSDSGYRVGYFPLAEKSLTIDINGYNSLTDSYDSRSYSIHNSGSGECHNLLFDFSASSEVVMYSGESESE